MRRRGRDGAVALGDAAEPAAQIRCAMRKGRQWGDDEQMPAAATPAGGGSGRRWRHRVVC